VPPRDAAALAEALAEALALPDDARRAMGERAIASIAARFTSETMKRLTLEVYDGLLGSDLARRFRALRQMA
jgi:glycosyltransferase involved in cell wall biosynthesis